MLILGSILECVMLCDVLVMNARNDAAREMGSGGSRSSSRARKGIT